MHLSRPSRRGVPHCIIGDDVIPYHKRRERHTVVVELNGHSGLSVLAEWR